MNATETFKVINSFLKPVSKLILFFFTTKTGIFLLISLLVLYFVYKIFLGFRQQRLLNKAAFGDYGITFADFVNIIVDTTVRFVSAIIANFTVILTVIVILVSIVGLSATFTAVDNFLQNQRRIKELKTVLKNLNENYKVAKIKIVDYDRIKDQTTVSIKFFDYARNEFMPEAQKLTLKGHQIYFLTYVLNFDYSEIEAGNVKNLAFPYKIFTEKIKEDSGIMLNVRDTAGIPYIYHRNEKEIYGLDSATFYKRLKEIVKFIDNPDSARKQGVRSFYLQAPHNITYPRKGTVYTIFIEQTGGLVIKREKEW